LWQFSGWTAVKGGRLLHCLCCACLHGAEMSLRHFGTSAELSQHFMKGLKCPTDTSALVPNCLRSEVSWVQSVCTPLQLFQKFLMRNICNILFSLLLTRPRRFGNWTTRQQTNSLTVQLADNQLADTPIC